MLLSFLYIYHLQLHAEVFALLSYNSCYVFSCVCKCDCPQCVSERRESSWFLFPDDWLISCSVDQSMLSLSRILHLFYTAALSHSLSEESEHSWAWGQGRERGAPSAPSNVYFYTRLQPQNPDSFCPHNNIYVLISCLFLSCRRQCCIIGYKVVLFAWLSFDTQVRNCALIVHAST